MQNCSRHVVAWGQKIVFSCKAQLSRHTWSETITYLLDDVLSQSKIRQHSTCPHRVSPATPQCAPQSILAFQAMQVMSKASEPQGQEGVKPPLPVKLEVHQPDVTQLPAGLQLEADAGRCQLRVLLRTVVL